MTLDEADDHAERFLNQLRAYPPAEAITILTMLCVKAILCLSPRVSGGVDKSCLLFFEGIVQMLQSTTKERVQ